jgi:hypothetical protein
MQLNGEILDQKIKLEQKILQNPMYNLKRPKKAVEPRLFVMHIDAERKTKEFAEKKK